MLADNATSAEFLGLAHALVQDLPVERLNGPASNEIAVTQGAKDISLEGMFSFSVVLQKREYRKNGIARKAARTILGERKWTDVIIGYNDLLDPNNNRYYHITADIPDVTVVVGDLDGPTETIVRSANASDICALNQALAFETYKLALMTL